MDKRDRIKTLVTLLLEIELFSSSSSSSLSSSKRHLPSFCLEANNCIEARGRLSLIMVITPRGSGLQKLLCSHKNFAKVIMLQKLRF